MVTAGIDSTVLFSMLTSSKGSSSTGSSSTTGSSTSGTGSSTGSYFADIKLISTDGITRQYRFIETGSIELVGIPAYAFGTQLTYFDSNGEEIKGPYITDVSLRVGSNGLTTSYSFSTQRKFGDLGKLYEDRIRKSQSDIMQRLSRAEEQMERVKRGIGQYQKD